MIKKMIALCCLVAFVAVMAGCGAKDAGSASGSAGAAAKQTATDSSATPATKKKAPEGS